MIWINQLLFFILSPARPVAVAGRLLTALLLIQISSCTPGFFKDDHIEVGTVISKTATTSSQDDTIELVHAGAEKASFFSAHVEQLATVTDGNVMLLPMADSVLRTTYRNLEYKVRIRLCIRRTTEEYRVDLASFNALKPGIIAKFKLDSYAEAIDSLIAY